jgi:hypothetical protein
MRSGSLRAKAPLLALMLSFALSFGWWGAEISCGAESYGHGGCAGGDQQSQNLSNSACDSKSQAFLGINQSCYILVKHFVRFLADLQSDVLNTGHHEPITKNRSANQNYPALSGTPPESDTDWNEVREYLRMYNGGVWIDSD